MKIFITMSAYNEEKSIPPLLDAIIDTFNNSNYSYQIVLIDDGSSDKTVEVVESYAAKAPIKIITHIINKGLGKGIKTAIRQTLKIASDEDIMVCMDADNTHHPQYILPMIRKIEEGFDIVIASRFIKGSKQIGVPFLRKIISFGARITFKIFLNLKNVRDYTCGFRAFRVKIVREATKIIEGELNKLKPFQAFAVLLSDKATGIKGGKRAFGNIIVIRCVNSLDAMTATPSHIPFELLQKIQEKITKIPSVVRVCYDLTPKPPATIEYI